MITIPPMACSIRRATCASAIAEIRDGWRIRPEQVEEKKRQMRAAFPYPAVNGGSL